MKQFNFEPNYNKCKDDRKEIYWNICKHLIKDDLMFCSLKKGKFCPAWKDFNYRGDI